MTRSPFAKQSPKPNAARKNASGALPIVQLVILGIVITIFAAVFIQNLQPLVQVFFLGQKTLPIPLSGAMLIAFMTGGLIALVFNAIASWQQNLAIRRAVVAAGYGTEEKKEQVKPSNPPSSYQAERYSQEEEEDFEEDEYEEEDLEEEEEELYEEEEEDDDPDTVPYGDRKNLKSAKPNREKRDRPPLEARYIR